MPVKHKPTKSIDCQCGISSVVDVIPATAYIATTLFECSCGTHWTITDYMNGITTARPDCDKMDCMTCDIKCVKHF